MKKKECVILSPHFDDAGLGIPAFLKEKRAQYKVNIVTLNSISVWAPGITIKGRLQISAARAKEDKKAFKYLCGTPKTIKMDFLDAPLRGVRNVTGDNKFLKLEKLHIKKLRGQLRKIKNSLLLVPLGIKHIDHLVVTEAVLNEIVLLNKAGNEIVFYEEMPICGMVALIEIKNRIKYIEKAINGKLQPFFSTSKDIQKLKKKMLSFYPSQIRADDLKAVFKHLSRMKNRERLWRVV
ncbi:MAG: PIG-L family deacetylase [bacterium]